LTNGASSCKGQPRGRFSWQVLMKERHSFDQRCLFLQGPATGTVLLAGAGSNRCPQILYQPRGPATGTVLVAGSNTCPQTSHGDGSLGRCWASHRDGSPGTSHGWALPRGRFSWQVSDGGAAAGTVPVGTSRGDGSCGDQPRGRFLWQVQIRTSHGDGSLGRWPATGTVLLAGVGQPRGRFSWQVLMKERHSLSQPRGRFSWQVLVNWRGTCLCEGVPLFASEQPQG
jgi:hypothetical protein